MLPFLIHEDLHFNAGLQYKWLRMKRKTKTVDIHLFKTVMTETDFGKLNMLDDIGWLKGQMKIKC